jgi:hypothetical protein
MNESYRFLNQHFLYDPKAQFGYRDAVRLAEFILAQPAFTPLPYQFEHFFRLIHTSLCFCQK